MSYLFDAASFPTTPGVYLMKDSRGKILYVGKAKSLRARLGSYFRASADHTLKTQALLAKVVSIDTLDADTEKDALLLEASLIKKHRPRYNVVLRDDKDYVLFRLTKAHEFPRLTMTRKVVRDGSVYYGPFTSARDARATLKALGRAFPLRKCSDRNFANRVRPCLYHHIKQCPAPCVLDVDPQEYAVLVHKVEMFLAGRAGELADALKREMQACAEALRFERAAELRDQIRAVAHTLEQQTMVLSDNSDLDALNLAESEEGLGLGLLFVRQGRLLDQKSWFWPGLSMEEGPEVVAGFLAQYYGPARYLPRRIMVPYGEDDGLPAESLEEALSERCGSRVRIVRPAKSAHKRLMGLASAAARPKPGAADNAPEMIAKALRLPAPADRIEAVDATHHAGQGARVGMVVFEQGRPLSSDYRLYDFPELEGASDDYAALAGWMARRYKAGPPWPDVVLVDGGKGQLAAVERALSEARNRAGEEREGEALELASIAKPRERLDAPDTDLIFRPGRKNPLPLKEGGPELLFLQRIRDEAHRFVNTTGRTQRRKRSLASELSSLPGVGPATAKLLWSKFDSLEAMAAASVEDLEQLEGVGRKRAANIAKALGRLRAGGRGKPLL
ncbi:MAG: excinuclease ABC subunit UvrC [Desulfovibrionaceae bacterium]